MLGLVSNRLYSQVIGRNFFAHASRQYGLTTSPLLSPSSAQPEQTKSLGNNMRLKDRFLHSVLCLTTLSENMTPEELVEGYGYKQRGGKGPNNTEKPENQNGEIVSKWEAWTRFNDLSQEDAQEKLINLINQVRGRIKLEKI